jgi:hypothetical protein
MIPNISFKMWPKDLDSTAIIMAHMSIVRRIIDFLILLLIQSDSLLCCNLLDTPHTERSIFCQEGLDNMSLSAFYVICVVIDWSEFCLQKLLVTHLKEILSIYRTEIFMTVITTCLFQMQSHIYIYIYISYQLFVDLQSSHFPSISSRNILYVQSDQCHLCTIRHPVL